MEPCPEDLVTTWIETITILKVVDTRKEEWGIDEAVMIDAN